MSEQREHEKTLVWEFMTRRTISPSAIRSARRRDVLRCKVWNDNAFWYDIIDRHGIIDGNVEELRVADPQQYDHCVGNFWGMLMQTFVQEGQG